MKTACKTHDGVHCHGGYRAVLFALDTGCSRHRANRRVERDGMPEVEGYAALADQPFYETPAFYETPVFYETL